ncbi:aldehyde dehydrogenase family protein [Serratia nevei]|uniref:aldehyde dehydrogenase family protein n=1 Tax=Serratia nevei TaxID=2703794 RepID=UPI003F7DDEA6
MADIHILPQVSAFLAQDHGQFIDGQYQPTANAERLPVVNPANGRTIADVASASADDVVRALESAGRALQGDWGRCLPAQRQQILLRLADLLEAHREEFAQLEALTNGKLIGDARRFEVDHTCVFIRYYAGWATKLHGETLAPSIPSFAGEQYTAMTYREPVGVVAAIVPWNFPVMIAIWKVAAALCTGCCIVLKPSEFAPLTLLRLAELAHQAGVPAGVFNVVNGGRQVGQWLIEHPRVNKVSFTGSVPAGIAIGQAALKADLTRVTLELGGKNPAAFLADVDAERAVDGIMLAGLVHQGQVCSSAERFYVHASRFDEIVERVIARVETLRIGSPLDETTQYGPLANQPHFARMQALFERARQGGQVLSGGQALVGDGFYVTPTVIRANGHDDPLMREEAFAGVLSFMPFEDEEQLLQWMNDSAYGLSASLWTNDFSKALRLMRRIEAGMVWINSHTIMDPAVPFGGWKASGIGREFGSAFIESYTELKSVIMCY